MKQFFEITNPKYSFDQNSISILPKVNNKKLVSFEIYNDKTLEVLPNKINEYLEKFEASEHNKHIGFLNFEKEYLYIQKHAPIVIHKLIEQNRVICLETIVKLLNIAETGEVAHVKRVINNTVTFDFEEILAKLRNPKVIHEAINLTLKYKVTNNSNNLLSLHHQIKGIVGLKKLELNGIIVNTIKLQERKDLLEKELKKSKKLLESHGLYIGSDNLQFDNTIIGYLDQKTNIHPLVKQSNSNAISFKKLDIYADRDAILEELVYLNRFNEHCKIINSILLNTQNDNRVYSNFEFLTKTGRTSSNKPNLQAIPSDEVFRKCFIPEKGNKFIIADYKQIEMCALAQIIKVKFGQSAMADIINEGIDLHKYTASQITNKSIDRVTLHERNRAKICNFGFPGGMGIDAFIEYAYSDFGIKFTNPEARRLQKQWINTFPGLSDFFNQAKEKDFATPHESETLTGRVIKCKKYGTFLNSQFQGLAADGAKIALYTLSKMDRLKVVNFIHDEFVIEIKNSDTIRRSLHIIKKKLIDSMQLVIPDVAISVDLIISDYWQKP